MFRRYRELARGNVFLHRLRVAYARSLTFAGLGDRNGIFSTTNKRQFTRRKISRALREKRVPAMKAPAAKRFFGGAASCRSIFVIFPRKLHALKARQNTGIRERGNAGTRERGNGGNGNFLTQIPQIAQILWEERHLAAPFLLFFLANSKR